MGVHRLSDILAGRGDEVGGRIFPVGCRCFEVTSILRVEGILFEQVKQSHGQLAGLLVVEDPGIFGKCVNGKCLGVKLFAGVGCRAGWTYFPVDTPVFVVPEIMCQNPESLVGHLLVNGIGQLLVGGRVGPQDPGHHHHPLWGVGMGLFVGVDQSKESLPLRVIHFSGPIIQDIVGEFITELSAGLVVGCHHVK